VGGDLQVEAFAASAQRQQDHVHRGVGLQREREREREREATAFGVRGVRQQRHGPPGTARSSRPRLGSSVERKAGASQSAGALYYRRRTCTAAGGDNGIAEMWKRREISVSSCYDQSHYLPPQPYLECIQDRGAHLHRHRARELHRREARLMQPVLDDVEEVGVPARSQN
jgi:hypothetical protein